MDRDEATAIQGLISMTSPPHQIRHSLLTPKVAILASVTRRQAFVVDDERKIQH